LISSWQARYAETYMAPNVPNPECSSRSEPAATIKALASGIWLASRLCINPAVAHEVISMMHPAALPKAGSRQPR